MTLAGVSQKLYYFRMLTTRETPKGKILSAGYPAVEDLIESENFGQINATFEKAHEELVEASRHKGGLGRKGGDAKKAMKSIEIVMDLLKELLAIKYRLQSMVGTKKE